MDEGFKATSVTLTDLMCRRMTNGSGIVESGKNAPIGILQSLLGNLTDRAGFRFLLLWRIVEAVYIVYDKIADLVDLASVDSSREHGYPSMSPSVIFQIRH